MGHGSTAMARNLLVILVTLFAMASAQAANTEPAPSQAAKPLVATVPDWKALDDDPLPPGALLRIGSSRAIHGIGSNIVRSKDGKLLYAGMMDRSVWIWEGESGKLIRRFKPLPHRINRIDVTPDGKTIAAAASQSVHLLDVGAKLDIPRTLQGHTSEVMSVAFASDGKTLVSGSFDKTARLWDVEGGKPMRTITIEGNDGLTAAIFAHDDRSIITCGYGGGVKVYRASNGEKLRSIDGVKGSSSLHLLPDGKTLVAIAWNDGTYFWDLSTGELREHLKEHHGYGAISPDGRLLVTCAISFPADASMRLRDLKQGRELTAPAGHKAGTYLFAFALDGKTLTTYGNDHTLRRWDLANGKEIGIVAGHQNRVTGACFTRDGKQIVSCSQDGTVRFWDASTGKELQRLSVDGEHFDSLALAPDGNTLAIAGSPHVSRWRWELPPDKRVFNLRFWNIEGRKEENRFYIPGHSAYELHFTPDGREVLSVGYGRVVFHDVKIGKERRPIADARQNLRCASLSPDGKTVAIATDEPALRQIGKASYYDAATGKEIFSRTMPFGSFNTLAFSPDGKRLAISEGGQRSTDTLSLWQVPTDKIVRRLTTTRFDHYQLAYSLEGRLVAAVDPDGISVFETATGQVRQRYEGGHFENVRCIAFSPDGRKLLTAGDDTLVLIWDLTGIGGAKIAALEPRDLDAAWAALADLEGDVAGRNIGRLAARPAESVPYLRTRLGLLSGDDRKRIDALVAQLDADQFRVRDKAAKELEAIGEPAVPALSLALERSQSEEMRTQAERLLKKIGPGEDPATSAVARRVVRAVEALERAGTPEAIALLKDLTTLGKSRVLHDEAAEALKRLK